MSPPEGHCNNINNNNEQLQQSHDDEATANGHRPDPNHEVATATTTRCHHHHHHHHHHHEATSGPHKEGDVASYHFECRSHVTPWVGVQAAFTFNGHAAASSDKDEGNSNNGYSLRKLSRQEKKHRKALLGIKWYHRLVVVPFRSWMMKRRTTPQILFVQNLHPTKAAHVILLTPQSKESMESFFRVALSLPIPSASPAGGELSSHQVYQLLEASDQFKEVRANNGAIFQVGPNGSGLNHNHYVHAAVLFRADAEDDNDEDKAEDDTNDTFVYCLSQLADVNPQRNALVVQPTSLENGTTPKPKVTVTMEQTGKWTIRTYHGAATK